MARYYEYDAVTGKLVAIIEWVNGNVSCRASDLPRGETPMLTSTIIFSEPPGPPR